MKTIFDGLDFSFAIQVRSKILYEDWNRDNEDTWEKIWKPTHKFLHDLAKTMPRQVNFFFGKEFYFKAVGPDYKCRNIFIVNHRQEVMYLCTVFNDKAFFYRYRALYDKGKFSKPIRHRGFYIVASQTKDISEMVIIKAIQRYLRSYNYKSLIPSLAQSTPCLFSEQLGIKYDNFIDAQAELLAEKNRV